MVFFWTLVQDSEDENDDKDDDDDSNNTKPSVSERLIFDVLKNLYFGRYSH